MNRIFIDMDGVIVDFDARLRELNITGDELKKLRAAYLSMPEIPGAVAAVRSLIGMGYDVFIATKPPTGISWAYADKAQWVLNHLPELKRKIIITHDKGLLGDQFDYLIDDRPHKANCEQFKGRLFHFRDGFRWPEMLTQLRAARRRVEQWGTY
jgi:5'(3')-deoxyribonucleotidase